MEKFTLYFNTLKNETITKAALIHGVLVGIHPFKDGNGRIARFITDKLISKELGTPLFISESINSYIDKTEYNTALDQFHLESNPLPLIRFFYIVTISQLKRNIEIINELIDKFSINIDKLLSKKISIKYAYNLAFILTSESFVYLEKIIDELNVSKPTAIKLIKELLDKNILSTPNKEGRIIYYKVNL